MSLGLSRGGQECPLEVRTATTEVAVQSGASASASPSSPPMDTSRLSSARRSNNGAAGRAAESSGEMGFSGVLHMASQHLLTAMCIAPDASMLPRSLSQVAPDKGDLGACEGEEAEIGKGGSARESELEAGACCDICCSPKDDMLAIVPCHHELCSLCFLSLCCYSKPSKVFSQPTSPACPFCRAKVTGVTVAPTVRDVLKGGLVTGASTSA